MINNFVDGSKESFDLNLISRKEDVQVNGSRRNFFKHFVFKINALKEFYADMKTSNKKKLERADYIGLVLIPRLALIFVAGFWTIGILNYNYPGFSQVSPSDQKAELAKMLDLKVI